MLTVRDGLLTYSVIIVQIPLFQIKNSLHFRINNKKFKFIGNIPSVEKHCKTKSNYGLYLNI